METAAKYLRSFYRKLETKFANDVWDERMRSYRKRPRAFAEDVLGSRWWSSQRDVANLVASNPRIAVKSANGVGKTYLAADLALWFLYSHRPSVVLTTAPTWRQVRHLLWEEIRSRFRSARISLPGSLLSTRISVAEGWFALGLATDDPVKFQGFHAENLLIIFDEASGVPESIWEAAEGVAVGGKNKILAIGNPLTVSGQFHKLFQGPSAWKRVTISALDHPNITGNEPSISGAVTPEAIDGRIADWCEPADSCRIDSAEEAAGDIGRVRWRGRYYKPNNLFRARVLGEFPDSEEDTLIPLAWIQAAVGRKASTQGCKRIAADVARFGGDSTVIGLRTGSCLRRMEVIRGADLMEVTGRIVRMAYEEQPETIAIDAIGLGAGVVDRLVELDVAGVEAVNVALPAMNSVRFANRRAEMYWSLRERFRRGGISIPDDSHAAEMMEELAGLKYMHTSRGQIRMESKDDMKRRGLHSPDHADMLAMLFYTFESEDVSVERQSGASESLGTALRREMHGW